MHILVENIIVSNSIFIRESTERVISINDAPPWVQKVLGGSLRTIKLDIDPVADIPGNWHDANVRVLYGFNGKSVAKVHSASYDSLMNSTPEEVKAYRGGEMKLYPEGGEDKVQMVLVTNSYPKGATLYAHPDNIAPDRVEGPKEELTPEEDIVMVITASYIASYRREAFKKAGINNYEDVKKSLATKGYMNSQGALTLKAKDYLAQHRKGIEDKYHKQIRGW